MNHQELQFQQQFQQHMQNQQQFQQQWLPPAPPTALIEATGPIELSPPTAVNMDDVPSDLQCSICMEVPMEPCLTSACEHVFCEPCLDQALQYSPACPNCRTPCTPDFVEPLQPPKLAFRLWGSIQVQCTNHGGTCPWRGSISEYSSHLEKCSKGVYSTLGQLRCDIEKLNKKVKLVEQKLVAKEEENKELKDKLKTAQLEMEKLMLGMQVVKEAIKNGSNTGTSCSSNSNTSATDLSATNLLNTDAIFVRKAGVKELNGVFFADGMFDSVFKYTKKGTWNGQERQFTLFRHSTSTGSQLKQWYISLVPLEEKSQNSLFLRTNFPGNKAEAFYVAIATGCEREMPTNLHWTMATLRGRHPPPNTIKVEDETLNLIFNENNTRLGAE